MECSETWLRDLADRAESIENGIAELDHALRYERQKEVNELLPKLRASARVLQDSIRKALEK
jgi:hypothetical protein